MSTLTGQGRINYLQDRLTKFNQAAKGTHRDILLGITAAIEAEKRLGTNYSLTQATGLTRREVHDPSTHRRGRVGKFTTAFKAFAHEAATDIEKTRRGMLTSELQIIDEAQGGTLQKLAAATAAVERLDARFGTNGFTMLQQRTSLKPEQLRDPQPDIYDPGRIDRMVEVFADLHKSISAGNGLTHTADRTPEAASPRLQPYHRHRAACAR